MAFDYTTLNDVPDYEKMPERFQGDSDKIHQESQPQSQYPNKDKILESIFASSAPNPKYNKELQERREKVARINTLGRGFGVLGDILSLKTGAPVKRRQPDQTTPAMLKSYQDYIQDYENKMDASRYRDFQQKLANKRLLLSDVYQQEDKDFREKQFKSQEDYRDWQKERAEKADELNKKKFEFQKRLPYIQAELAQAKKQGDLQEWIQKETLKLQFNKEKNKYYLYDSAGKPRATVNSEGDIQKLYDVITSDPAVKEEAKGLMNSLKAELGEGVTMNHMKIVVSQLWDMSDVAKQYLGLQEKEKTGSFDMGDYNTRPEYEGPIRPETDISQPQIKQPEYSTGGYY